MLDFPLPSALDDDTLATDGDAEWFEYSKAANPIRPSLTPPVPYRAFGPELYATGPTSLIPLEFRTSSARKGLQPAPRFAPTSPVSFRVKH
jgi:hypothetical protein